MKGEEKKKIKKRKREKYYHPDNKARFCFYGDLMLMVCCLVTVFFCVGRDYKKIRRKERERYIKLKGENDAGNQKRIGLLH